MSEKTVKVCTYNVQMKDQYPGQEYSNKTRAQLIARLLAQSDYDVLVFEEAFDNDARSEMAKILMAEGNFSYRTSVVGNNDEFNPVQNLGLPGLVILGAYVSGAIGGIIGGAALALGGLAGGAVLVGALLTAAFLTGHPKSDGGIFIMSRWPIMLQSQIVYEDSGDYDRFARKGVSWALINKEGLYFNVFGTHTQSGGVEVKSQPRRPGHHDVLDFTFLNIRRKQFEALRAMIDSVQLYWLPTVIAGDMNVDYCFANDRCPNNDYLPECCSDQERQDMLHVLNASLPQDLSRYVYTSDPANEFKGDDDNPTTLDYVLSSNSHLAPISASLETVKLEAPWTSTRVGRGGAVTENHHDLSDHYTAVGTFTFPLKREDTRRFTGTWKCVLFNEQPDVHGHRLTLNPLGIAVVNEFDGAVSGARIYDMQPGSENGGKIVFRQLSTGILIEYDYAFNSNADFEQYFIPGDVRYQKRPRRQNELLLRNQQRSMLYAFESWLPVEPFERPGIEPV